MTSQLIPTRQALLAVAAYAAVLLTTVAWLLADDSALRELKAVYGVKSEMLDGLRQRVPTDLGAKSPHIADLDVATVAGSSETVAAGALQRYLLERLESAGGAVQSIQTEPRREIIPPGLHRLGAQLAFDASMVALQRFLFELETGLPFVFVESLAAQPTPGVPPGSRMGDILRVSLTVTSYWKAGADR